MGVTCDSGRAYRLIIQGTLPPLARELTSSAAGHRHQDAEARYSTPASQLLDIQTAYKCGGMVSLYTLAVYYLGAISRSHIIQYCLYIQREYRHWLAKHYLADTACICHHHLHESSCVCPWFPAQVYTPLQIALQTRAKYDHE